MKQEEIDELDKFMANEGLAAELKMLDDHSDDIADAVEEDSDQKFLELMDGIKADRPNEYASSEMEKYMVKQLKIKAKKLREVLKQLGKGNLSNIQ